MGKITKDDSIMIKGLREAKQWSSRRLIREFPQKAWSRARLDKLLSKIDYAVWGALQEMVYHRKTFTSVQELKHAIVYHSLPATVTSVSCWILSGTT